MVNRLRLGAYALFGVVFSLGVVCGAALGHTYAERAYAALLGPDREGTREQRRLEALARELALTDVQREQVGRIFEQHRPERERRLAQMFETCGHAVIEDKERLDAEVRGLLSPEQHASFDAFTGRHRRFGRAAP